MAAYNGFTEAQARAHKKYLEKKATIQIIVDPDQREAIKGHAKAQGESVNFFITRAIDETMERDKGGEKDG